MALLVPDDSLLHFSLLKISFINQNETSFIRDRCCYVTLCLHLIEPNWITRWAPSHGSSRCLSLPPGAGRVGRGVRRNLEKVRGPSRQRTWRASFSVRVRFGPGLQEDHAPGSSSISLTECIISSSVLIHNAQLLYVFNENIPCLAHNIKYNYHVAFS